MIQITTGNIPYARITLYTTLQLFWHHRFTLVSYNITSCVLVVYHHHRTEYRISSERERKRDDEDVKKKNLFVSFITSDLLWSGFFPFYSPPPPRNNNINNIKTLIRKNKQYLYRNRWECSESITNFLLFCPSFHTKNYFLNFPLSSLRSLRLSHRKNELQRGKRTQILNSRNIVVDDPSRRKETSFF